MERFFILGTKSSKKKKSRDQSGSVHPGMNPKLGGHKISKKNKIIQINIHILLTNYLI